MKIQFHKFKESHAAFLMQSEHLGYGIGVVPNEHDSYVELDIAEAIDKLGFKIVRKENEVPPSE